MIGRFGRRSEQLFDIDFLSFSLPDHKPYECDCGKVFRRNCDLRRHALTHAVGDVPGLGDQGDSNQDDIQSIKDDGEEDTLLEVDSPLNSPNNSGRSPSPLHMPVSAELNDETDEPEEFARGGVDELEPPPTPAPDKPEKDIIPVTHCHHERPYGSRSPYTMRPSNGYDRDPRHRSPTPIGASSLSSYSQSSQDSLNSAHMQSTSSRSDMFHPMLHVRRDLHHKVAAAGRTTATVTSGLVENRAPSFLSSIPLRKRPIGPDGEAYLPSLSRNIGIYGLHRNHPLMKPPDELMMSPLVSPEAPNLEQTSMHTTPGGNHPQMMSSPPLISPTQAPSSSQQQLSAAPKRTGFSIEDIMRR